MNNLIDEDNTITNTNSFSNKTYSTIPFSEYISKNGRNQILLNSKTIEPTPITIMSSIDKLIKKYKPKTVGKYSFTEDEITMNITNLHKYIKLKSWDTDKIKELNLIRRRVKNCIYSQRARSRRKAEKQGNTEKEGKEDKDGKEENIWQLEDISNIPDLIHYKNLYIYKYKYI
jgi:hypothetical protein